MADSTLEAVHIRPWEDMLVADSLAIAFAGRIAVRRRAAANRAGSQADRSRTAVLPAAIPVAGMAAASARVLCSLAVADSE